MQPSRYSFADIFTYDATNGLLVPRFTVIINNARYPQGVGLTRNDFVTGLNLFNYVGRPIAGIWNAATRELTVLGFY